MMCRCDGCDGMFDAYCAKLGRSWKINREYCVVSKFDSVKCTLTVALNR